MQRALMLRSLISLLVLAALVAIIAQTPKRHVTAAPGKLIVGYAAGWSVSSRAEAASLDGSKLSVIIYAFVGIDPQTDKCTASWKDQNPGETTEISAAKMADVLAGLNDNKAENPALKVLLSIGGGGYQPIFEQISDYAGFAQSCYDLMVAHGADGIDVDYEFPETPENSERLTQIVDKLHARLNNNGAGNGTYLLTMGAPASDWYARHLNLTALRDDVDYFTTMAYNYHGDWDNPRKLHFNSPMTGCDSSIQLCMTSTASYYLGKSIPKSKTLLGIGWYGNRYVPVGAGCLATPGQTDYSGNVQTINYNTMRSSGMLSGPTTAGSGWTRSYNGTFNNAVLCSAGTWIGYEDVVSTKARADWIKDNGYPGMMIWELFKDYDPDGSLANGFNGELLDKICESFNCSGINPPPASSTPTPDGGGGGGTSCWTAWSATAEYNTSAQVSRNGTNYQAAYWSQGKDPLSNSGPAGSGEEWIPQGACGAATATRTNTSPLASATATRTNTSPLASATRTRTATPTPDGGGGGGSCGGLPIWNANTTYAANQQVRYNTTKWTSAWTTIGETPGASGAWRNDGACPSDGATATATRTNTSPAASATTTRTNTSVPPSVTPSSGTPAWSGSAVAYAVGARVSYNGAIYECTMAHTSQANWAPDQPTNLWKKI